MTETTSLSLYSVHPRTKMRAKVQYLGIYVHNRKVDARFTLESNVCSTAEAATFFKNSTCITGGSNSATQGGLRAPLRVQNLITD